MTYCPTEFSELVRDYQANFSAEKLKELLEDDDSLLSPREILAIKKALNLPDEKPKEKKAKTSKKSKTGKLTMKSFLEEMTNGMSPKMRQLSGHSFIKTSTEYDIANAVIDLFCKDGDKHLIKTCGEKKWRSFNVVSV